MKTTNTIKTRESGARQIATTALMAAVVCAIALIPAIPTQPVPFTMQVLGVLLAPLLLGLRGGASVGIYILLGACGLPIFANGASGIGAIVGPTGGFIIGFFPAALAIGFVRNKTNHFFILLATAILSLAIIYGVGVVQLSVVAKLSLATAVAKGAAPFIMIDVVKAVVATLLAETISKRVKL
ncbi:MAG: biotin transporter BioY [Bacillota bacterium]|nr:biotin transporter BioY [Bacillota bacterium]